jgi:hypothetical protein
MKKIVTAVGLLLLLAIAAFCVFGFLATFEPTDKPGMFMAFRIGYVAVGIASVVGTIALIVNSVRKHPN